MHPLTRLLATALLSAIALSAVAATGPMQQQLLTVEHQWARINYQVPADKRDDAFAKLQTKAQALAGQYPNRAEPKVWEAIVLSSHAGTHGGLGALSMVRKARDLLLAAKKIDPDTMNGSIYTSLGSLYYQVPGWPLGFGNDKKARTYLLKALAINPNGIDPNYFYADYLVHQGDYNDARTALLKVLHAPARPNRPIADKGRRAEAQALLNKIKAKS